MKVKVYSPDGDTDFDIVAGILQGVTLAPCLFIICQDNVLRTSTDLMKHNGFTLKWQEADNTLHKLLGMQTTQMTSRFLQIHLTKLNPCCRQQEALASMWMDTKWSACVLMKKETSLLNSGSLKLMNKYLSNSDSSTEKDIKLCLAKTWTAIDR